MHVCFYRKIYAAYGEYQDAYYQQATDQEHPLISCLGTQYEEYQSNDHEDDDDAENINVCVVFA
jgi:hypothetical protein